MLEIVKGIDLKLLGPAFTCVVVILLIVLGFILKFNNKGSQADITKADTVVLEKETFNKLFDHEGRLSSTETKVKSLCDKFDGHRRENNDAFKLVFNKLDLVRDLVLGNNPGPDKGKNQDDNVKEAEKKDTRGKGD